jgi:hypothetical protein
MNFEVIDRPKTNRHRLKNELDYDNHLEAALLNTLGTGRAIRVTLSMFHCSPAKGRLWMKGYRVKHRVLEDKEHVGAWVEREDEPEEGDYRCSGANYHLPSCGGTCGQDHGDGSVDSQQFDLFEL